MFYVRKAILSNSSYQVNRCFPKIPDASCGDKFANLAGLKEFIRLPFGVFWWLINIRPGYLIFQQGDSCMIERYMPSYFAKQFSYNHLYVGNPNTGLRFSGNLFEGARAWYYSVAEGTWVVFSLPHKMLNCYMSLSFCICYSIASRVPRFRMNTSCIKSIKASYKVRSGSKSRMRGMSEYMEAERAAEKEARKTEAAPGSEYGAGAAEEHPLKGLGKLCLTAAGPLLSEVSLARRRQELGLRLQLQRKYPR